VSTVYVVVPDGIDDPLRPSGGNVYDRRVVDGLAAAGWDVRLCPVPGEWPLANRAAQWALGAVVANCPDGAVVLVDGLIASTAPGILVPEAGRVRLVVLVHMPLGGSSERSVLTVAEAVVATSEWTRRWLLDSHALRPQRVHVAAPGAEAVGLVAGSRVGGELLCVAAVTAGKGHDVLIAALTAVVDLRWRCLLVGSTTRDPALVRRLVQHARAGGVEDRVDFAGARTASDLDKTYAEADLVVLASRSETYGMVVTEALARGIPVLATDVGGLPEAMGYGRDHVRPGILVPPGDAGALAGALRDWLEEESLRRRLRQAAAERRDSLTGWSETSAAVAQVLTEVAR
jgi:glycosyltransferase involved in cell wall biosynthesis